jgi:hypothetical protein
MAKTYEPIATTTLGSAAASYTFSSIPSTYTDLRLVINGLQTGTSGNPYITLNSDTGTNYSITVLSGNGTTATSSRSTSAAFIYCGITAEVRNTMIFMSTTDLMNYSNTTTNKTVITRAANASFGTDAIVGLWRNTAAITSITVDLDAGNWNTGSTFTLYGIKAA